MSRIRLGSIHQSHPLAPNPLTAAEGQITGLTDREPCFSPPSVALHWAQIPPWLHGLPQKHSHFPSRGLRGIKEVKIVDQGKESHLLERSTKLSSVLGKESRVTSDARRKKSTVFFFPMQGQTYQSCSGHSQNEMILVNKETKIKIKARRGGTCL